jgi:hypothetical protein
MRLPKFDCIETGVAAAEIITSAPQKTTVEDEIKQEKLLSQRLANRRAAEEESMRRGQLMRTQDARQEMSRVAGTMMQIFEGCLPEFATAIASRFSVPQRDVLHELKTVYVQVRKSAEERERRRAQDEPEAISLEVEGFEDL